MLSKAILIFLSKPLMRERKALITSSSAALPDLAKQHLPVSYPMSLMQTSRLQVHRQLKNPRILQVFLPALPKEAYSFIDEIHRLKAGHRRNALHSDGRLRNGLDNRSGAICKKYPDSDSAVYTYRSDNESRTGCKPPLQQVRDISFRMNFYETKDIISILKRSSGILGISIDEDAVSLLAQCSRGTPRVANRLLRRMRDFAQVEGLDTINRKIISTGLKQGLK